MSPGLLSSPILQRWEFLVTLAAIVLLTLALMLAIERIAERSSGDYVQWGARLFIPLPALLLLGANYWLHLIPLGTFQGQHIDLLLYAAAFITFCLPWVISSGDERRTTVRLVLAAWGIYIIYAVALVHLLDWAYTRLRG